MEISKLSPSGVKIKTKQAMLAVSPQNAKVKLPTDVILLFNKNQENLPEVEDSVLIVDGPGDYEVKGVKFSGIGKGTQLYYFGKLDGVDVLAAKATMVEKFKDTVKECDLAIIDCDGDIEQAVLASLNAKALVFYGLQSGEIVKKLGKPATSSSKYSVTKDKLPGEMEVILLS